MINFNILLPLGRRVLGPVTVMLIGRRLTARLAHYLLDFARRDVANDPDKNGERLVQSAVLQMAAQRSDSVILDIGANIGDWSATLADLAPASLSLKIFAAEPAAFTFDRLAARFLHLPSHVSIFPINAAFSASRGKAYLHVFADLAGINSLHPTWSGDLRREEVDMESIDSFCEERDLSSICFIKIDTEGHDFEVIRGGVGMLANHAIRALQFEYNHRWIHAKHFLKEVFDLLSPLGYEIGKITPRGIEFYSEWTAELESFREGNYLAALPEARPLFPFVKEWNA